MATLQEQIAQKWGQYGDWNAAGQNQTDALAKLLQANGVEDLSKFSLKARDWKHVVEPGMTSTTGDGSYDYWQDGGETGGTAYDAFYDGKQLGYLGDINDDGTYTAKTRDYGPEYADIGKLGSNDVAGNGSLLGWSANGHGNTSFSVVNGPDGQPVIVPVWGSSSQNTYNDARAIASMVATAFGAYYAPQSSIASGALQGQGTAVAASMLNPNATPDSTINAGLGGFVTGGIGGGIKTLGAEQGWSPNVTKAASNAATTAARGGDLRDVAGGAVSGGLLNFTGDPALDRAIAAGGSTLIRGGSGSDALRSGVLSGAPGLLSPGSSTNSFGDVSGDVSGDALSEDNIVRFDGGTTVGEDFDFDAWLQEQIDGSNRGTDPYQFNWEDFGVDPGTDYSNEGRNYPTTTSTQGPGGSPVNSGGGGTQPPPNPGATDWFKILAPLLGAAFGANSSRDQNQQIQREPWKPAQPYLEGLLKDGAQLYDQYKQQPFSQSQQAGYTNIGSLLDLVNNNAGGLLSGFRANASGANQFQRGTPGLLQGSSFNPTAEQWQPQGYGDMGMAQFRRGR